VPGGTAKEGGANEVRGVMTGGGWELGYSEQSLSAWGFCGAEVKGKKSFAKHRTISRGEREKGKIKSIPHLDPTRQGVRSSKVKVGADGGWGESGGYPEHFEGNSLRRGKRIRQQQREDKIEGQDGKGKVRAPKCSCTPMLSKTRRGRKGERKGV